MIPQRILLQGFLCYRDRTEIGFDDDSPLWMLSGLNGSGKSAVFDAVTFALFGGHRGGIRNAEELVNKESDGLVVEFDFLRGDAVYRIKRTLKKQGRSSRQILKQEPIPTRSASEDPATLRVPGPKRQREDTDTSDGKDNWKAVENTGNQRGFDEWVRDNIGLTYETFTSSVLLMQGKAEKLLNADGGDRRKVLAGIVDLERYEKLHKRADEQRKKYKDQAEELQQKLELLAEVGDEELIEAAGRITAAEAELETARQEVERWQRLRVQGERWAKLCASLADAERQWERAQGLLQRAEAIERDADRLRLLRHVLPQLRTAIEQRERLAESTGATATLTQERDGLLDQARQLEYAQEQTRQKREQAQEAIAADQQREQEVGQQLVRLSDLLARVDLCERQRRSVAALEAELAKLPADPGATLIQEQDAHERLAALAQAVPFLTRLWEEREELKKAGAAARRADDDEKEVVARGMALAAEAKALEEQVAAQMQKRQQADVQAAEARTLLGEAIKHLEEITNLEGAKVCRHCGQALTREHVKEEHGRRTKARVAAESASQQAEKARKAAVKEEKRLLDHKKDLDGRLEEARGQVRDYRNRRQQALQEVERRVRECGRLYQELAEPFRARVAPAPPEDWPATTYPSAADLDDIRLQVQGLDRARQQLQKARAVFDQWNKLQGQRETARRTLLAQEADLPPDAASLKQQHAALKSEDAALKEALKRQRANLLEQQRALERLEKKWAEWRDQLAERERRLEAEKVRQEGCRETLTRTRGALPESWRDQADRATAANVREWAAEQATLEKQGAETKAEELQQARERLEFLRQEKANRAREREEVPAEARCELAELNRRLDEVKRRQTEREGALGEARNEQRALLDRRQQRRQLHKQHLAADQQYNRYRLLAELLGPKRLQLFLVRQAERGIVDYANEVLDRLSGGQLYLRLRGEDSEETAEKALDLECYNRTAGEAPLGVAFLSGSQRFRVAVSLALGIGQYASHQHRPIESVIIDEGFGCLDRQGRQVMIQELQNLRGHMRCILLVSHQEEFAEAFANGYRFELTNGTTAVTRFQR